MYFNSVGPCQTHSKQAFGENFNRIISKSHRRLNFHQCSHIPTIAHNGDSLHEWQESENILRPSAHNKKGFQISTSNSNRKQSELNSSNTGMASSFLGEHSEFSISYLPHQANLNTHYIGIRNKLPSVLMTFGHTGDGLWRKAHI